MARASRFRPRFATSGGRRPPEAEKGGRRTGGRRRGRRTAGVGSVSRSARETFVEPDRTLDALRDGPAFHTQRNTLFAYAHVSDMVALVTEAITASFEGHERVWVSAPDTVTETPTTRR